MKNKKFYIWQGVYKTFNEANRFKKGLGFKGQTWRKDQTKIFNICKKFIGNKKKIPNIYKNRNNELIPIIKKYLLKNSNIKILDFGGGFGIAYYILKESFKKNFLKFDYTILEIPYVAKFGKKLSPKIKFINKFDQKKYDLIYSSSTIQYFKNWKSEILKFIKLKPKYIFLSDIFVGKIPTFISLQKYYESTIPHWFINFDEFNDIFIQNGYHLKSKKKTITKRLNYKNKLPMDNFKDKYILNNTLSILYEKK